MQREQVWMSSKLAEHSTPRWKALESRTTEWWWWCWCCWLGLTGPTPTPNPTATQHTSVPLTIVNLISATLTLIRTAPSNHDRDSTMLGAKRKNANKRSTARDSFERVSRRTQLINTTAYKRAMQIDPNLSQNGWRVQIFSWKEHKWRSVAFELTWQR